MDGVSWTEGQIVILDEEHVKQSWCWACAFPSHSQSSSNFICYVSFEVLFQGETLSVIS